MFLFQGADGRIPHDVYDPIAHGVWPLWSGEPIPWWRFNERFSRNLTVTAAPQWVASLPPQWQWIQFLPLLMFQAAGILALWRFGLDGDLRGAELVVARWGAETPPGEGNKRRHPPVIRSKHQAAAKTPHLPFPPLRRRGQGGATTPPASDPIAAPIIPHPPHLTAPAHPATRSLPRRPTRIHHAVRHPAIQSRQALPLPRLRSRPNPLPPPDLPPSVPSLAVRQRSTFRLGQTSTSNHLPTTPPGKLKL